MLKKKNCQLKLIEEETNREIRHENMNDTLINHIENRPLRYPFTIYRLSDEFMIKKNYFNIL